MMFTITDYAMNMSGKLHGWFDVFYLFISKKIQSIIILNFFIFYFSSRTKDVG